MILIAVLMVLLVLCAGGECFAEGSPDKRLFTPDYSKLCHMGCGTLDSSSPCIGNPVTPECAAITEAAVGSKSL